MKIDPSRRGKLPQVEPPVSFSAAEGRLRGWRVAIPGRRPLATPAVVDGRVFLGGGFGSYDFFAFDADTGAVAWQYQTTDDGPTAAAVHDGYVAFNTECCELEVLTVDGVRAWKVWLGDPLMSMPAIDRGRVFIAYPDSKGDRRHYLGCFDLATDRQHWRQPIAGEIITAPVLADGHIHFATLDGTLACVRQDDGVPVWQEPRNATSSPVVWEGQCYFSQREEVPEGGGVQQTEHLAARGMRDAAYRRYRGSSRKADYLDILKRQRRSPRYAASDLADAGVGFSHSKGDAKLDMAMKNLGHAHVHGIWAYQGSKPFVSRGRLYAAHGDAVRCADPHSEEVFWTRTIGAAAEGAELLDSPLTPPATVNGKLFFGTVRGELLCLSAATGEELWRAEVGEPIVFQPAVARGRVYAGTEAGSLICLETGDPGDDGWLMWGADSTHNGLLDR
jgi:outer membrane protein assembly factor BamB